MLVAPHMHLDPLTAVLLVVLGSVAGVLSGFFGIGGGWIVTPVLNFCGMPMSHAIGTGLAYILGTSAISVWRHRRHGNVSVATGLVTAVLMIGGLEVGKMLVLWLEARGEADQTLRLLYIAFLVATGIVMVRDFLRRRGANPAAAATAAPAATGFRSLAFRVVHKGKEYTVPVWVPFAVGIPAGLLSGMLGVGGGILLVPAFLYLLGFPPVLAVGTSLLCIMLVSPFGVATYAWTGRVDFVTAALMVAGAAVGAPAGSSAARCVQGRYLVLLYGLTMFVGAIAVTLKQAGWSGTATAVISTAAGTLAATVLILRWRSQRAVARGVGKP